MNICVISPSFPTAKTIDFVFVDQLCRAFADLGNQVTVIAPQSITKCLMRGVPISRVHSFYKTSNGNSVELYRPYTITSGNGRLKNLFKDSYQKAVKRAFKRLKNKPDVCYGHFWGSIASVYPLAKAFDIPLFGASGEENVAQYANFTEGFKKELREYMSGAISVSTKNQNECIELKLVGKAKSIVIPNAIDQKLFGKQDKSALRERHGLMSSDFVVAFVGQFVPRKGTLRLNEALKKLNDKDIKAIFMGSGAECPDYDGIIFKGTVPHDKLPEYLGAADVFVLPTENEGCCNAIIEAMACGLPIISTDAAFNYDVLNSGNSIMIDCHSIEQIAESIKRLKDDEKLRASLAIGALKTASDLSIDKRAKRIIDFMKSKK